MKPFVGKPATTAEVAEMLNICPDSVKRAKQIQQHGVPELSEAVRRDEISLAAAVDLTGVWVTRACRAGSETQKFS